MMIIFWLLSVGWGFYKMGSRMLVQSLQPMGRDQRRSHQRSVWFTDHPVISLILSPRNLKSLFQTPTIRILSTLGMHTHLNHNLHKPSMLKKKIFFVTSFKITLAARDFTYFFFKTTPEWSYKSWCKESWHVSKTSKIVNKTKERGEGVFREPNISHYS